MIPRGSTSVMQRRVEPPDSLDFFPTPPWATRALFAHVLRPRDLVRPEYACWEPACGEGHMAGVLSENFARVIASDVFDYGHGGVRDFLGDSRPAPQCAWVITNPPFKTAGQFALKALDVAGEGVALLVRTSWLEGGERFRTVFKPRPPTYIAQFAERVPMVKGRWDPSATTATSYAWIVWCHGEEGTRFLWIPPGCRTELTKSDDRTRFAAWSLTPTEAPLLGATA